MKKLLILVIGIGTLSFALSSYSPIEPPVPAQTECFETLAVGCPWSPWCGWVCCYNGVPFEYLSACNVYFEGQCNIDNCDLENPACTEIPAYENE